MSQPIVAISGLSGAGKTEAATRFVALGYTRIYFGQITMDELERRRLPVNEANERMVREGFRKEHGMGAFATLNMPTIDAALARGERVLIDGLYSWSEYTLLKDRYGDRLTVVAIYAPPTTRYRRLELRGADRSLTAEEARSRDYSEIENIEKAGPIAMADSTILNTGTLDDLTVSVQSLAATLVAS